MLKSRFLTKFPVGVTGSSGIFARLLNGRLQIRPAFDTLADESVIPDGEYRWFLSWNETANVYTRLNSTGLGNVALATRAATSVIGRSANSDGLAADIVFTTNGHVLQRVSDTLGADFLRNINIASDAAIDSSKLAHTPAGTGAVARSTQTWMREWNLTNDRNVTGNGSVSDATALQQSITPLDAGNGGRLHTSVPATRYLIDSGLTISGDYPFDWDGFGQPELRSAVAAAAITVGTGPSAHQGYVTIRNQKITGQSPSTNGIKGNFSVNLHLEKLNIATLGAIGVWLDNCYSFRADGCQFYNNGSGGMYITGASMNSSVISRCKFVLHNGTNDAGINIDGTTDEHYGGLITSCDFENNFFGIVMNNIDGLEIGGVCWFENNTAHIYCGPGSNVTNLAIRGGQFLGTGYVELNDYTNLTIENCTFWGTGTVLVLAGGDVPRTRNLRFPNGGTISYNGSPITAAALEALGAVEAIGTIPPPAEATAAEMEAASASTPMVSPRRMIASPYSAKAWVFFNSAGTILAGTGVTSVTKNGTGDWTLNLATAFSSSDYSFAGNSMSSGAGGLICFISRTASTIRLQNQNTLTATLSDPSVGVSVHLFGDQ